MSDKPKAHDVLQGLVNVFGKKVHFEALDHMKDHMAKVIMQNMKLSTSNKRMRKALEEILEQSLDAVNNGCADPEAQYFARNIGELAASALKGETIAEAENTTTEETQTHTTEGEQQA